MNCAKYTWRSCVSRLNATAAAWRWHTTSAGTTGGNHLPSQSGHCRPMFRGDSARSGIVQKSAKDSTPFGGCTRALSSIARGNEGHNHSSRNAMPFAKSPLSLLIATAVAAICSVSFINDAGVSYCDPIRSVGDLSHALNARLAPI